MASSLIMGFLIIGSALLASAENPIQVVSRSEWSARPPVQPASSLAVLPAPYVIISHTATTQCYTISQCTATVRNIQSYHMDSKSWDDIGYNFLVGGDGYIYEGRGWDVQGAHTKNYNSKSIGISFIGSFEKDQPTNVQLEAAKNFLEYGLKYGKLSNDYKLLGQRQVGSTTSPGDVLYNIIKTWDHWSSSS